jgi:hypothetical protein
VSSQNVEALVSLQETWSPENLVFYETDAFTIGDIDGNERDEIIIVNDHGINSAVLSVFDMMPECVAGTVV